MLLFWVPMKDQWKTSDLAVNTKCYPTSIDYINPEIEETPAHALFPLNTASIKRVDIYLFFVKVIKCGGDFVFYQQEATSLYF